MNDLIEEFIKGQIEYRRRLEQMKKDCCITTASREGLLNLCKLIGIKPEERSDVPNP